MNRARAAATAGVWVVLLAAPWLLSEWKLSQLSQLLSYGIFAMSLAFVWGQAGLLCFGQAVFFGIGAYAMAVVTKAMIPGVPSGTGFGLAAAAVAPGLLGLLAGLLLFRGKGLSGAYFAIVTLAAAVVAERAASHSSFIGGFNGLLDVPPLRYTSGGATVELFDTVPVYYVLLTAALLVFLTLQLLVHSPAGTVLRALRDNAERSSYFGFDVGLTKTVALAISAAVAGFAGGLFATQFGFVSPALIGVPLSTEVLIWTALGGREALLAAFLGAILVRTLEAALSDVLGYYWLLALGGMFIASVVLFPAGLLGRVLAVPPPRRLARLARAGAKR